MSITTSLRNACLLFDISQPPPPPKKINGKKKKKFAYGNHVLSLNYQFRGLIDLLLLLRVQGIWAGMIFGGTATQTLILAIITVRCDWDKEVIEQRRKESS